MSKPPSIQSPREWPWPKLKLELQNLSSSLKIQMHLDAPDHAPCTTTTVDLVIEAFEVLQRENDKLKDLLHTFESSEISGLVMKNHEMEEVHKLHVVELKDLRRELAEAKAMIQKRHDERDAWAKDSNKHYIQEGIYEIEGEHLKKQLTTANVRIAELEEIHKFHVTEIKRLKRELEAAELILGAHGDPEKEGDRGTS